MLLWPFIFMGLNMNAPSGGDCVVAGFIDFDAAQALPEGVASVRLSNIVFDETLWVRLRFDGAALRRYSDALKAGQEFPPVELARLDGGLFLVDGAHRVEAYRLAGLDEISARISDMTRAEVQWASASRNMKHGVPLRRPEKRRVFAAYMAAGRYKVGRSKYKSYRDMGEDLGIPFSTLRNWMREGHRAIYDAIGDKSPSRHGPSNPELPPVRMNAHYLTQAKAAIESARAFAGVMDCPLAMGELVSELEVALQEAKSRPHEAAVRPEDNPNF